MSLTRPQLAECTTLRTQGWSFAQLAGRYGVSAPTLCRLMQRHESNGGDEAATLTKAYATGPRDEHQLTPAEIATLKLGVIENRSRRLAADRLMRSTECSAETFARLEAVFTKAAETRLDEQWPKWFTRACIVTEEERLSFRGPKALAEIESARSRGCFFRDENGTDQPLYPNAVWEFDDESENTPWLEIDENGKSRVNRQSLKAIDVYSSFYLGLRAVSRDSDGYRIEDQADFLLELIDAHGMPSRCRIERGPWDNNFWFGIPLPKAWWHSPACATLRWGGIHTEAGGPIHVMQAKKSREKGLIEGSFNHRQNLAAHETLDIGRFRGEHEAAARLHRLALSGNVSAIARFPSAGARADVSADVLTRFNSEPKKRLHFFGRKKVVPAELYAEAVRRELPAADRFRFMPCKAAVTVRRSHIQLRAKGIELPLLFSAEGFAPQWDWHAWLPHGWRVLAAFHPTRLDLGCHIFNGLHPDHPENPRRFPLGMPLGVLPYAPLAPVWNDAPDTADFGGRKKTAAAVRAETRIIRSQKASIRVSTVVAAGRTRTARIGSADPLANLEKGAAPLTDADIIHLGGEGSARSEADHLMGSGEAAGRGGQDHEAQRNSAGRSPRLPSRRESALAALEALESDLYPLTSPLFP
jgi:hypothetical protein